ncbi:MAG TPA: cell envelope integrity protein TolA [Sphingobium sp.]|uniref:cell envelope integrity protein TolA n=1 Tax=Sphingobium sp. TaxID=1912891 RepID=UPI002ED110B7
MTAGALPPPDGGFGNRDGLQRLSPGRRSLRQRLLIGAGVIGGGFALLVMLGVFSDPTTRLRPNETRTVQVVLPPPPPPPPPPEVKPVEKPPEPTPMPTDQPQDTPPPEPRQQSSEPSAPGDNALTAREGAGPSNYGLAAGNGSGARIGGRPGGSGDAFAAYAQVAQQCIRQAAQSDKELSRGRYAVRLAVSVDPDGRIADVHIGDGDAKRTARIREVLTGLQCSQRPPAGMPVTRVELRGG